MPIVAPPVDRNTQALLDFERRFAAAETVADRVRISEEILGQIRDTRSVLTSSELDYFLQLAMLYFASVLKAFAPETGPTPYKIALLQHSPDHKVMVVKPLFYSSGRCVAIQPTVATEPTGEATKIGQTGVSLQKGEFIYCRKFGHENCEQYVGIQGADGAKTRVTLCVPISSELREGALEFLTRIDDAAVCSISPTCAPLIAIGATPPKLPRPIAVLDIESNDDSFGTEACRAFLSNDRVLDVLERTYRVLERYKQERGQYKTLKACAALFDLSQHNLVRRQAYEALLDRISAIAGGADVTLHLRDLGKEEDATRAIRLVEGVGRNVRGLLMNDRQATDHGLIGRAFAGKVEWYSSEEIRKLSESGSASYKQLMPATLLNLAIPLPETQDDPQAVVAVVNIEWDAQALRSDCVEPESQARFVEAKKPALLRACQYFSLAVNHYNLEERHGRGLNRAEALHLQEESDRRLSLSFHVAQALDEIERYARENAQEKLRRLDFLQGIIDAAGYHLNLERKTQFSLTLHRFEKDSNRLMLVGTPHGLRWQEGSSSLPLKEIDLAAPRSVVAFVAAHRRLVSGCVHEGALYVDPEIGELPPSLPPNIPYLPIEGYFSVYEVAVPVAFGSELLGVLNFEKYLRDTPQQGWTPEEDEQIRLTPRQIDGFREWADAIALCIAFANDLAGRTASAAAGGDREELDHLRCLVAQIIANVKLPPETVKRLAEKYLRALTPFEAVHVHILDRNGEERAPQPVIAPEPNPSSALEIYPMRHQGYLYGYVGIDATPEHAERGETHALFPGGPGSETASMALRFFSAYQTAVELSTQYANEADDSFVQWLDAAVRHLKSEEGDSKDQDDPGKFLHKTFARVHQALLKGLEPGRTDSNYGWYLYESRYDPEKKITTLEPGPLKQRWVFMQTREMTILREKVRREGDGLGGLARVLAQTHQLKNRAYLAPLFAGAEPDLEALQKALESRFDLELSESRFDDLVLDRIFTELLGDEPYQIPDGQGARAADRFSITLYAWEHDRTQCFPDIGRNPFRGDHPALEWFFSETPYAIISVPIRLDGEKIGILNLLRRRHRTNDFKFFKSLEISRAAAFADQIGGLLKSGLHVQNLLIAKSDSIPDGEEYGPAITQLSSYLRARLALPAERPIKTLLITPVADQPPLFERIFDRLPWTVLRPTDAYHVKTLFADVAGEAVVIFYPLPPGADFIEEYLRLIDCGPSHLILATSPKHLGELHKLLDMPGHSFLHEVSADEILEANWEHFLSHFGATSGDWPGKPAAIKVLLRTGTNPWNLEHFKRANAGQSLKIGQAWDRLMDLQENGRAPRPTRELLLLNRDYFESAPAE